jgi:hypothetical protein
LSATDRPRRWTHASHAKSRSATGVTSATVPSRWHRRHWRRPVLIISRTRGRLLIYQASQSGGAVDRWITFLSVLVSAFVEIRSRALSQSITTAQHCAHAENHFSGKRASPAAAVSAFDVIGCGSGGGRRVRQRCPDSAARQALERVDLVHGAGEFQPAGVRLATLRARRVRNLTSHGGP